MPKRARRARKRPGAICCLLANDLKGSLEFSVPSKTIYIREHDSRFKACGCICPRCFRLSNGAWTQVFEPAEGHMTRLTLASERVFLVGRPTRRKARLGYVILCPSCERQRIPNAHSLRDRKRIYWRVVKGKIWSFKPIAWTCLICHAVFLDDEFQGQAQRVRHAMRTVGKYEVSRKRTETLKLL